MKFYCRPKAQEKQHFGKSHFYCHRFFPGNTVTIILDNEPPFHPPRGRTRSLGGRKNPRVIVGENYCRFGASYRNIPSDTPRNTPKIRESYFWVVFLRYFRGIFSIPCRRVNLDVGLVFWTYFGVCGVFCSVAGSSIVNYFLEIIS